MTRRQFGISLMAAGALGLIDNSGLARWLANGKQLSRLANRTAGAEGAWRLKKIEGKLPKDLFGTLYRVAPGQKENHGVALKHRFDGDAFMIGYSFREGSVQLAARFVDTPQRREELKANRMLYGEFGTLPPAPPAGWQPAGGGKNQPSVNVICWDNRLLGLSEGGHPTAIDPTTLAYQGRWDFYGTLPGDMSFTAHPKYDPVSGIAYGYGVRRGPGMALTVYRMEKTGRLTELYALPQKAYFMIHDMMMSKEHLIFIIPPVFYNLSRLQNSTPADAVTFAAKEATRIVILRRDGTGKPLTVELPSSMVFHHGNAFERDGKLVMDSCLAPDGSVFELLYSWSKESWPNHTKTRLTRLVIDLASGKLDSRNEVADAQEFPHFDIRQSGTDVRYLYTLDNSDGDPFLYGTLVRHDLHRATAKRIPAGKGRAFGEPIFVPHPGQASEERGWLLLQGYDGGRDENFLEIRDAGTLDIEARVWAGQHFPLGFHGNFSSSSFVAV